MINEDGEMAPEDIVGMELQETNAETLDWGMNGGHCRWEYDGGNR